MQHKNSTAGFTLVELAIVLVIIGLIVGGVLVGQDLIKAATVQKTIRQETDTEAAASTFRTKYNALPGDMKNPTSVFASITGSDNSSAGLGNGDDLITGSGTGTTLQATGETAVFYYELAQAGLIKETMTSLGMAAAANTKASINAGMFLPGALGHGLMLAPFGNTANNRNYIIMTGAATADADATTGIAAMSAGLLPVDAANIDTKLDDGDPTTGNIVSTTPATPSVTVSTASGTACFNGGGGEPNVYNSALTPEKCSIAIRTSF